MSARKRRRKKKFLQLKHADGVLESLGNFSIVLADWVDMVEVVVVVVLLYLFNFLLRIL